MFNNRSDYRYEQNFWRYKIAHSHLLRRARLKVQNRIWNVDACEVARPETCAVQNSTYPRGDFWDEIFLFKLQCLPWVWSRHRTTKRTPVINIKVWVKNYKLKHRYFAVRSRRRCRILSLEQKLCTAYLCTLLYFLV